MKRNSEEIADVDVAPSATPAQIAAIMKKAREQWSAEKKIEKLEKDLKAAKAELKLISSNELPALMTKANMDACPLDKGYVIEIENIVTASIPSPDSDRAENAAERNRIGVDYMRKAAPSLLKNQIIINFGIEEEKFFKKFMRDLQQRKREVDASVRTTVHAGTLGKWVRDQDKLGKSVDEAALNVHRIKCTVIKAPKAKGAKERV